MPRPPIPIDLDEVRAWLDEGVKFKEIAERLGVSQDTVKHRLYPEKRKPHKQQLAGPMAKRARKARLNLNIPFQLVNRLNVVANRMGVSLSELVTNKMESWVTYYEEKNAKAL